MIGPKTGKVITFYSYKGGTGRTLALANVGWILASNGFRVLAIDWDLEAPGLHRFLKPFLIDPELESTPGVIDFVWDLAKSTLAPTCPDSSRDSEQYAGPDEVPSLSENAVRLDWEFDKGGYFDFLPAGQQGGSYAKRVNAFDWENFYGRLGGGHLLDRARDQLRDEYDYVLIDSRTGVSDTSGICTIQMPDVIVGCFTLNNQSIEGVSAIFRSVIAQRGDRKLAMYPMATRVELGEKEKVDAARRHARGVFKDYVNGKSSSRDYWSSMEVPYFPYYAYEEILATFGEVAGAEASSNTLLDSMERVTQRITGHESLRMPNVDELVRRGVLSQYSYGGLSEAQHSGDVADSNLVELRRKTLLSQARAWFLSDMDPLLLLDRRSLKALDRIGIDVDQSEDQTTQSFLKESYSASLRLRILSLFGAVIVWSWGSGMLAARFNPGFLTESLGLVSKSPIYTPVVSWSIITVGAILVWTVIALAFKGPGLHWLRALTLGALPKRRQSVEVAQTD